MKNGITFGAIVVQLSLLTGTALPQISGLHNFDVIVPSNLDVNDFHIEVTSSQPGNVSLAYPQTWAIPGAYPAGLYGKPVASAFKLGSNGNLIPLTEYAGPRVSQSGNTTTVTYGPTERTLNHGDTLHFGVSFDADLFEQVCMNWTLNGANVGDASQPIVIKPDDPPNAPDQIINQCGVQPLWIGPVSANQLGRQVELGELVLDGAAVENSTLITDSLIRLAPGESYELPEFGADDAVSTVYWYEVFEDVNGAPGPQVGIAFNGFNVVPEPNSTTLALLAIVPLLSITRRRGRNSDREASA